MHFVDTHAHLDDEQFDDDRANVLTRALDAGVTTVIAIGCTAASSQACVDLAASHPRVFAAVGLQPNGCAVAKPGDWDEVVRLSGHERVVALGETGLDRYWDYTPFPLQQDYFDRHLRLSQDAGLPFVVHMRDCGGDILEMLTDAGNRGPLRGVMHSYTGDAALAGACIDLGLYISFAGMVTYKKATELREVAMTIPLEKLLIETDSPYLSPYPRRGQRRNEPALVVHTAECLAETRGESLETLAAATTANAFTLFDRLQR